ncbi:MAG: HAD family hydrolase, partial [Rudaea sp.]
RKKSRRTVPSSFVPTTSYPIGEMGMPGTAGTAQEIQAIVFDMGGTLRTREPYEPTQRAAIQRMFELLGVQPSHLEELERRYASYGDWAKANLQEATEEEIWTRWMAPDLPRGRVERAAKELTLLWRERLGRAVVRPDAGSTLVELARRGYRLALVSNTTSSLDVPRCLDANGWTGYFQVVILSSTSKVRKPSPGIFWLATRAMGIEPRHCAYLGDRISRDVVGSHTAGFGMALLIDPLNQHVADGLRGAEKPDAVVRALSELLGIFPPKGRSE